MAAGDRGRCLLLLSALAACRLAQGDLQSGTASPRGCYVLVADVG